MSSALSICRNSSDVKKLPSRFHASLPGAKAHHGELEKSDCSNTSRMIAQGRYLCKAALQGIEPLRGRDDFRVGDGVGRACEQVGEADLRAHARGQHTQRQRKRADFALSRSFNAVGFFRQTNFQNSICAASSSFNFC
jgi:hypothetical protein